MLFIQDTASLSFNCFFGPILVLNVFAISLTYRPALMSITGGK